MSVRVDHKPEQPPYVIDYHVNICKKPLTDLPKAPQFGNVLSYTFADKTRDNFFKLL